ncbi:MAG: pantetheine-phosphate adenylyltransferase [Candidatus Levyibacteriota bacterium]|nr:MAG: pantetheine-phosphate adenylyltransferase [Candidatus Levybacteria bacterium]
MKLYHLVACGGTFDHFHKGHKDFLQFAIFQTNKLIIGITSDKYIENSKLKTQNSKLIESYEERRKNVEDFLREENFFNNARIVSIDDIFGPTLSQQYPIKALIVSEQTQSGAEVINKRRKEKKLLPLKIIVYPMTKSQDGNVISSSRIRMGEIDREGRLYIQFSWLSHALILPDDIRQKLKHPLGILSKDIKHQLQDLDSDKTITVGDVATKACNELSFNQKISIIDFVVQREKKFSDISQLGFSGDEQLIEVVNPPGSLTPELFACAKEIFSKTNNNRYIVKIDGEEDLAVLPFLLAAPLGFVILYGQPHEGVVEIQVSERMKKRAFDIVSKFTL